MKIGVLLDNKINRWALQRFEPLKDRLDITVFVGENNDYDVSAINLRKYILTHRDEYLLALKDPLKAYNRIVKSPYKKMDFYYFSLRVNLEGFDIIYSCDLMRSAYTVASLKEKLGFKFVLSWWENIPFRSVFDKKSDYQKRFIMERVDMFLPFTERAADVLKLEGVSEDKIEVVYPGVDVGRFRPGNKPGELMANYNVPEGSFVILYVGKLASWKGVHNLVYAARILKDKGTRDFLFVIAGKGGQRKNLERLIIDADVEGYFRFLDFVSYDSLPDVYRMGDILVLPSYPTMVWQEQFGMVLIEAMASGLPVISTRSGSIPEVVGDAGVLIPPGDFFALADTVKNFMDDNDMRRAAAVNARKRVEKQFNNKKSSDALYGIFKGFNNAS